MLIVRSKFDRLLYDRNRERIERMVVQICAGDELLLELRWQRDFDQRMESKKELTKMRKLVELG